MGDADGVPAAKVTEPKGGKAKAKASANAVGVNLNGAAVEVRCRASGEVGLYVAGSQKVQVQDKKFPTKDIREQKIT